RLLFRVLYMLRNTVLILITFVFNVYSQADRTSMDWIEVDSIVYQSNKISLPYPYNKVLDSAHVAFSKLVKKYYEEGAACVHPPNEKPKLFGLKYGKVISYEEYLKDFIENTSLDSCLLIFEVDIDWQGNITKARLKRYKGKLKPNWDFKYFFSNLKSIPSKFSGIPVNSKIIIPIRKNE
ncbi:hypothetical protein, partial [Lutibacter sp.]